tara:strand:+ start:282 stop:584 length:303 start_codon:yes stop_codon:yes gene_type:complete
MDNYKLDKMTLFIKNYENSLKQIFLTASENHGKGALLVDINNNNNGKCDTKYMSILNEDFWNRNEEMLTIKNKILQNTEKKIFLCLIDNNVSIFFDREYV